MIQIAVTAEGNYIVQLTPLEYQRLCDQPPEVADRLEPPLSPIQMEVWLHNFEIDLARLNLLPRIYAAIVHDAGRIVSNPATSRYPRDASALFVARWTYTRKRPHVARFYSFGEWCLRMIRPDAEMFFSALSCRKADCFTLVSAIKEFLERQSIAPDDSQAN